MGDGSASITQMLANLRVTAAHIRVAALYVPIVLCVVAYFLRRTGIRTFASPLLSFLWTLPSLLVLQRLNMHYGWWSFDTHTACVLGMPVALYLGWAIFWGLLPQLAWPKLDVLSIAIVAFSFDFWLMLYLDPALDVNRVHSVAGNVPVWLVGEAVGIALVLMPAMLLFRWTENDVHLPLRAGGQVLLSALVFLYLVPEIVFALRPQGAGWQALLTTPRLLLQFWLQVLLLLAVPGVSAVQEFVTRGGGTPLPYDPPRRMVTSGVYRYCANPMQFSCAAVMLLEAVLLRSVWLGAAAAMATIYSAGLAHWDEEVDLARRFGGEWAGYRAAVRSWRVRWSPYSDGHPSTLYVAATCDTCRGVRAFLEERRPVALVFEDAESLSYGALRRLTYVSADGVDAGVLAFARALEHLNFGWAFVGFVLRLPVVHHAAQLLMDVSGFGPRTVCVEEKARS